MFEEEQSKKVTLIGQHINKGYFDLNKTMSRIPTIWLLTYSSIPKKQTIDEEELMKKNKYTFTSCIFLSNDVQCPTSTSKMDRNGSSFFST